MGRRVCQVFLLLSVVAAGCESNLDNPADPESGAYTGFTPWVDAGREQQATVNDTLMFKGVFRGPMDRISQYWWDFDSDGRIDFASQTTGVAHWTFEDVGSYEAVFSVQDKAGFFEADTTSIVITNESPLADGGPDQGGFLNTAVQLPAGGSDDGRIVGYRWDFEGDGRVDWSSAASGTALVFYGESGAHQAVLEVVDDDANTARDTVAVSISQGIPVAIAGPDTGLSINDLLVFQGSGIDSNGTIVLYEWDLDGDGTIDWMSESMGLTERVFSNLGVYAATLTVTDDEGFSDTDTIEVTVTDEPPWVEVNDLGDGWCANPQTLKAQVSDDGTIVKYEWDFEGDGVFDWASETSSHVVHHYPRGDFRPVLRVTDDDGNVAVETLTFRVTPWKIGVPMRFARSGVGVEALEGILYVMSGYSIDQRAYTSLVEAFNPRLGRWEVRSSMGLTQSGLATAVIEDRIYGVAGCAGRGERGAVEEYWPEWDKWSRRASVRKPRCWPAAASVDGVIYVFGGVNDDEDINSVEVFDPQLRFWWEVSSMPTARHGMAAVVLDSEIYVIGGYGNGGALDVLEVYDPATDTWDTRSPMPTPRTGLAAVVWNDQIYTFGGSYLNVVEIYDPATDTWREGTPMFSGRYGLGAAVIGNVIYVAGGESPSQILSSIEVYFPACD